MQGAVKDNWIRHGCGKEERVEASFRGAAFSPHRHDTYAIGVTLQGVQRFDYRGSARNSLPGDIVVLHPDELHDGRAGTEAGFRYRTIYIKPSAIQKILRGVALPFIEGGVSSDQRLRVAVRPLLEDFSHALSSLEYQDALYDLAIALTQIGDAPSKRKPANPRAAEEARQLIDERLDEGVSMEALEMATGHDRFELSRDFRALYGTSPSRYLTLRRLDEARALMLKGQSLASVAVACGFSDQSHFTRHFKKTYGLTPRQWAGSAAH